MSDDEKKSIDDLNKMLFDQMVDLKMASGEDAIRAETARAVAMVKVAATLISSGKVALLAYDLAGGSKSNLPKLINLDGDQDKRKDKKLTW